MSEVLGEKYFDPSAEVQEVVPVRVVEEYENPYRSMKSFADLDAQRAAEKASDALSQVFFNFKMISENILTDEDLTADQKASALAALTTELGTRLEAAREDPESAYKDGVTDPAADPGMFAAFKDGAGHRWLTVHTNKFRDKAGEIFTDAAHREYAEWANAEKDHMPVLRFWHIPRGIAPGSEFDLGQADLVSYDDNGFVIASGTFHADKSDVAERLAGMSDLGCSHGYVYRASDLKEGVYSRYRSFEVSILPRGYEANQLTLSGVEEAIMLNEKQRASAIEVLGEARVKDLEERLSGIRASAEASGISYKDVAEALVAEPEAPAVEAPLAVTPITATTEGITVTVAAPISEAVLAGAVEPVAEPDGSEVVPPEEAMPAPTVAAAPQDIKPDSTAALIAAMQTVMATEIAPLRAEIEELRQGQKDYAARLEAVEVSDDDRLAARIMPRVGPLLGAKAASTSPETIVPDDIASKLREQFKVAEKADAPALTGAAAYMPGIFQTLQSAVLSGGDD